jgi:hypothetical protein
MGVRGQCEAARRLMLEVYLNDGATEAEKRAATNAMTSMRNMRCRYTQ